MRIKLTESQLKIIENYITEREQPVPTNLSGFFNKHKNIEFFEIIKLTENGQESPYKFSYSNMVNGVGITDMNQGTPTKGCTTQVNLDTILYDNEVSVYFKPCSKELKLNKVIKIILYDTNNQKIDEMQFSNTSTQDIDILVDSYNDSLHRSDNGSEVFFDSNKDYNGTVFNKSNNGFEIELAEQNKPSMILYVDFESDELPFYSENGKVKFKAKRRMIGKDGEDIFIMDIKRFTVSDNTGKSSEETPKDATDEISNEDYSDEEFSDMVSNITDEVNNNETFRKALYQQPSFWQRLKAEITGKEAKGNGIVMVNNLVNSYKDKTSNEYLNANFREGFYAEFQTLEDYDLNYMVDDKPYIISFLKNGIRKAKVTNVNKNGYSRYLNGDNFELLVVENISTDKIKNFFKCHISSYTKTKGNTIKNKPQTINLQFLNSNGFKLDIN